MLVRLTQVNLARRMQLHDVERRREGAYIVDASGNSDSLSLRKPGFRYLEGGSHQDQREREQLRDARAKAYADYLSDLEGSWKTPQPATSTGAHQFATPQSGSPCTKNGYPGVWEMGDDGEMTCRIDPRANGATDGRTISKLLQDRAAVMEPIYESYAREISQAWKTK